MKNGRSSVMATTTTAVPEGRLHIPRVDNAYCVAGALVALLSIIGILAT